MYIFDPKNGRCKRPFGAVRESEYVEFNIYPERSIAARDVKLLVFCEATGEKFAVPMCWSGLERANERWFAKLDTTGRCGLIWYSFSIDDVQYGKDGFGEQVQPWQLTVYKGYPMHENQFGEGVTYQIFPDRFASSGRKLPDIEGRTLHLNWYEQPDMPEQVVNRDFFGGDIAGIEGKLPYLQSLGVETIYLNPIFLSSSNHRYDTADYSKIDPYLGTEDDFRSLCEKAADFGIKILIDGVFSHTGSDSVYFNALGRYGADGATQSQSSKYYSWYSFKHWPDEYSCWWGIKTLPEVNEMQESYLEFITGKDGIAEKWIKAGAAGWRLDVCDELPDEFLKKLRACVGDKLLIGEVWEDASNKISYGVRRKYLHEGLLDGVMNYPFREAVLSYAMGGAAEEFKKKMETLRENYPRYVYYNCMNFLGTHDTERVLTVLGDERRVMLAAAIMFAFPGCPTIYYGDEVGLDGGRDPLNRRTYPWGRENERLKNYFSKLGMLRKESLALRRGSIKYIKAEDSLLCFEREYEGERMILAANTSNQEATFFGKIIAPVSAEIWRME